MAMNRRPIATSAALLLAACGLAACGAPKAAPATPSFTSVSTSEATEMADLFCGDLRAMSYERAVERMATRASAADLTSSEQDAIVDLAARSCPKDMP